MAIYHLSLNNISRGKGQSAIASASYRSGEKLHSERYGKTSFYVRKVKPETFILAPKHAPKWATNREKLWNEVEQIEKSSRARLAKEINVALPIELAKDEQKNLIKQYVQENFVDEGMVADVAIHRDDNNNPHAHIMLTNRPFNPDGTWGSKAKRILIKDEKGNQLYYSNGDKKSRKDNTTNWNDKETLNKWRENWAKITNQFLEKNQFSERITEKSYAEQGLEIEPTIHEGYVAREMEKRGQVSDRCEENRQIKERNYAKNQTRSEAVKAERLRDISASLSPQEKQNIVKIAKSLRTTINPQTFDYAGLIDKERMVNNWEHSLEHNAIITDIGIDEKDLKNLQMTKENIQLGQEIMHKQADRIMAKYYPELNEKSKISPYYKAVIAQETIQQDKVLSYTTLKDIMNEAKENRLNYMLQTIVKNPYEKPVAEYQKSFMYSLKNIQDFHERFHVDEDKISTLSAEKQQEYKQLLKQKDFNVDTMNVLNKYYTKVILEQYPNANLRSYKIDQKEALAKAIDYYGNRYSIQKLAKIVEKETPNKYNQQEQAFGKALLNRIDKGQLSEKDWATIQSDPQLKEIFDTVTDEKTRPMFEKEIQGQTLSQGYSSQRSHFGSLFGQVNILDNLANAQKENIQREREDEKLRKNKKRKKQQHNKQSQKKNRGNSPSL